MLREILTIHWCIAILCAVMAPLVSPASMLPWFFIAAVSAALAIGIRIFMLKSIPGASSALRGRICRAPDTEIGQGISPRGSRHSFAWRFTDWITRHCVGLLLCFFGLASTSVHGLVWQAYQLPASCLRQVVNFSGYVADFPTLGQQSDGSEWQRFKLDVVHLDPPICSPVRHLYLTMYKDVTPLMLGDYLAGQAVLKPVPSQLSPGVLPDQARYAAKGIDAIATLHHIAQLNPDTDQWSLDGIRRTLYLRLLGAPVATEARGILLALVLGNGASLAPSIWEMFQRLGLSHVLVISGLHVGLVAGGLWWLAGLLRRCCCWPTDCGGVWFNVFAAISGATIYSGLAGFSLPTLRALIMLSTVLTVLLLGWRAAPWRSLYLAVLMILLVNPLSVLSSSLWMSAGATAVLLWLGQRKVKAAGLASIGLRARLGRYIAALLQLQFFLALFMLPLSLFWFSMMSLGAIVSNLLIVPVVVFWVVPLALTGALISFFSQTGAYLLWQIAAIPIVHGLPLATALDAAQKDWAVQNWQLSLVDLGLLCLFLSIIATVARCCALRYLSSGAFLRRQYLDGKSSSRNGRRPLLLATSFIVLLIYRVQIQVSEKDVVITILDVGQGTAVLLQNAGQTLLYDTGGGMPGVYTQAEKIVYPFLRHIGVTGLTTLVLSHRDFDHAGGRSDLAKVLAIKEWRGFEGKPCRPGEAWLWSSAITITTLSGTGHAQANSNDDSCVLLVSAYGRQLLLAGDISSRQERALVRYWRDALRVDLLLVGHHGSGSSSGWTWLKWVSPTRAIISAAYGNRFGHPNASVLDRLKAHGATIDSTATHGTLRYTLRADGSIEVKPMRGWWTPFWLAI